MTLIELSIFLSVGAGAITGAAAGARHGMAGLVLGGAAGLAIGFVSFALALSPFATLLWLSPASVGSDEERGLRAKFEGVLSSLCFLILFPFAPVGAGVATWWLVRLI